MVSDFNGVWDSVAASPGQIGRGNAMFASLSMTLLEFACRLCKSDATGNALREYSNRLMIIDARYFLHIPGLSAGPSDFRLPFCEDIPRNDLLICALYDVIRNGLAHQYQQILVDLQDGSDLGITLTGPAHGRSIDFIVQQSPRVWSNHLKCSRKDGDLWVTVNTARLFLDFKEAFDRAGLLDKGLTLTHLRRPDPKRPSQRYEFGSSTLENLLGRGRGGGFRKPDDTPMAGGLTQYSSKG